MQEPYIVIPDTHGHLREVELMVQKLRRGGYLNDHSLVFLGDYFDRGPDAKGLIDYIISLKAIAIAGNHDYVLRQVIFNGSRHWIEAWAKHYESLTLNSYRVRRPMRERDWVTAATLLREKMPVEHRRFLARLPLFFESEDSIMIHAGLNMKPWPVQRQELLEDDIRVVWGPDQVFSRKLSLATDHPAPKRLITGHAARLEPLITPRRVALDLGVDMGGPLAAFITDTNQILTVEPSVRLFFDRSWKF